MCVCVCVCLCVIFFYVSSKDCISVRQEVHESYKIDMKRSQDIGLFYVSSCCSALSYILV